jgi:hypothetical protein
LKKPPASQWAPSTIYSTVGNRRTSVRNMARRSNGHDLARHVMKVLVEAARREFGMQLAKSKPERSVEGMGTH